MSDNRTRIWFALFVLAVFAVGLASGVLLGRRMPSPGPPPGVARGPLGPVGPGGGPPPERLVERLDRVLRLTDEQRGRLEAIFESRRPRVEQMRRDIMARTDQEQQELQAEIRGVLDETQQRRFDRWLEEAPRPGRGGRGRGRN